MLHAGASGSGVHAGGLAAPDEARSVLDHDHQHKHTTRNITERLSRVQQGVITGLADAGGSGDARFRGGLVCKAHRLVYH